jgi:signal transduction histidine kinase
MGHIDISSVPRGQPTDRAAPERFPVDDAAGNPRPLSPLTAVATGLWNGSADAAIRAACLLAGLSLSVLSGQAAASAPTGALLLILATVMSLWAVLKGTSTIAYHYALAGEAVIATAVLVLQGGSDAHQPYLAYLIAPAVLAGLHRCLFGASLVVMAEAATLLAFHTNLVGTQLNVDSSAGYWLLTAGAASMLGAWAHTRWTRRSHERLADVAAIWQLNMNRGATTVSLDSARRLVKNLQDIPRDSPEGVDVDTICAQVMEQALRVLEGTRAALLLRDDSGVVTSIATHGGDFAANEGESDSMAALSIRTLEAIQESRPQASRQFRYRTSIPLVVAGRAIGAVVIDGPRAVTDETLGTARDHLDQAAYRLASAVMFSDVRAGATVAERRRLARDIHDGIAQDVASLGYLVDALSLNQCNQGHQAGLIELRDELTRIVTELRLSIFDLRSTVVPTGLGSVLADYVRDAGKTSGLAVHVTLEESATRLQLDVETELLRIAQEAVSNATQHAHASNLWVTCRVEPPFADIRIEDDGVGQAAPREDHYGLHIMKERADKIQAVLDIADRPEGGTTITAVLVPTVTTEPPAQPGGINAIQRTSGR